MNTKVCIIRAKLKKDYVYDAISNYGYHIHTPYKGKGLFFRIVREIWFRCNFPGKYLWYKKNNGNDVFSHILLFDPLITPDYIEWIHKQFPQCKIIISYENRADKTINPDVIPSYVEKWSYDKDDCHKYGMHWSAPAFFSEYKRKQKTNPKIDVLYVGRDKGRAEKLFALEEQLKKEGLKTYFHICADRQFLRFKRKFYKRVLEYEEYLDLLVDSKAILNIVPEDQTSVTQRELEAVFDGVKCITNNKGIKNFELYDESIYFVLGEDDLNNVSSFLYSDTKIYNEEVLERYEFRYRLQQVLYD